MKKTVLIPQAVAKEGVEYLEKCGYSIKYCSKWDEENLINDVKGCDAILLRTAVASRSVIESEPNLKIVARHGAGYNNVDLKAAEENGVYATNCPLATSGSVAETTIGLLLALSKRFFEVSKAFRNDDFYFKNTHKGVDVEGKTLGLIGFGGIARMVAKKAALGLDMKIIAFDPYANPETIPDYVTLVSRDEVFKNADFISLHTLLTDETYRSVGLKEFSLMKKSAYFINCSRGEVVNEKELIKALEDGLIAGAAIDVFDPEPPSMDNPLFEFENVILTPHSASNTEECMIRMAVQAAMEIHKVLSGEKPNWPVNNPKMQW